MVSSLQSARDILIQPGNLEKYAHWFAVEKMGYPAHIFKDQPAILKDFERITAGYGERITAFRKDLQANRKGSEYFIFHLEDEPFSADITTQALNLSENFNNVTVPLKTGRCNIYTRCVLYYSYDLVIEWQRTLATTSEKPSVKEVLEGDNLKLRNYLRWYAIRYMGIPKDVIVAATPDNEAPAPAFGRFTQKDVNHVRYYRYNPTEVTTADYFGHYDTSEAYAGILDPNATIETCDGVTCDCVTCDYVNDDEDRTGVYTLTVVGFSDALLEECEQYYADLGICLDGSPITASVVVTDDSPEPEFVTIEARVNAEIAAQSLGDAVNNVAHSITFPTEPLTDALGFVTPPLGEINSPQPTEKGNTMSQLQTTRRVVDITLMDNDSAILEASDALVATFPGIVTQDDDATTIQELIMNEDVAGKVKAHNAVRAKLTDEDILGRTGNKVKLREIKLKDLTWIVK